jgi:hypothetical protein
MPAGRVRRPPVLPPQHRGPALQMKGPTTRTEAVLRLRRQAARQDGVDLANGLGFTAGRGVRPGWRSDVAPVIRQGEQHHNLCTFNPSSRYAKAGGSGRRQARPRWRRPRDPPPSRDPRHRASPAVARTPRSREPVQPTDPFSRSLVTANSAAAQFSPAVQLEHPSCASMLPHPVRSEPCKVLVALPCAPV